ncbi:MAG: DUF1761 domain-containing protein [Sphingobacteriales bacterium]|nr:DUF1761 domain-containing protein [Sphingobacteriales bacterium]
MSFLLAVQMYPLTVHQMHFYSALMNHENEMKTTGTAVYNLTEQFKPYLNEFRTFKHGALHGFLAGVFFVLPIMATNGMFERKSWRYILVNWLYWTICITIMGAIICGWQ